MQGLWIEGGYDVVRMVVDAAVVGVAAPFRIVGPAVDRAFGNTPDSGDVIDCQTCLPGITLHPRPYLSGELGHGLSATVMTGQSSLLLHDRHNILIDSPPSDPSLCGAGEVRGELLDQCGFQSPWFPAWFRRIARASAAHRLAGHTWSGDAVHIISDGCASSLLRMRATNSPSQLGQ